LTTKANGIVKVNIFALNTFTTGTGRIMRN
jgi:hypothetical protein